MPSMMSSTSSVLPTCTVAAGIQLIQACHCTVCLWNAFLVVGYVHWRAWRSNRVHYFSWKLSLCLGLLVINCLSKLVKPLFHLLLIERDVFYLEHNAFRYEDGRGWDIDDPCHN